ncbi:hypothetical protein D9M70_425720 [compost metagenome]
MRGAVDVGVLVLVEVAQALDHRRRLLCGGRVVQPHQRLAVDTLGEDREIPAHRLHVEGGLRRRLAGGIARRLQARRGGPLEEVELPVRRARRGDVTLRLPQHRLQQLRQFVAPRQAVGLRVDAAFPWRSGRGHHAFLEGVVGRSRRTGTRRAGHAGPRVHLRNRRAVGLRRAEVEAVGDARRQGRRLRQLRGRRCHARCRRRYAAAPWRGGEQLVGQARQGRHVRQAGVGLGVTCKCLDSHGTCRPPRHRARPGHPRSAPPASSTARSGRKRWRCG